MSTDVLVIVLFLISIGLLGSVLRAPRVAAIRSRESWTYRLVLASLLLDVAGACLMLSLILSTLLFMLSQLAPTADVLWSVPMVLLLGANILALFLLRKSSRLKREKPA